MYNDTIKIAGVYDYPEINPTDGEKQIFEYIKALCPLAEFVRKSSEYVSAQYIETDIARFKFTERAKWILLPYMQNNKKRRIEKAEDLEQFKDEIIKSYDIAIEIQQH